MPRLRPAVLATPSAKTVQGLTPIPAATKSASPKPKRINPKTRPRNDLKGGRKVKARGALHHKRGIDFTVKNLKVIGMIYSLSLQAIWR